MPAVHVSLSHELEALVEDRLDGGGGESRQLHHSWVAVALGVVAPARREKGVRNKQGETTGTQGRGRLLEDAEVGEDVLNNAMNLVHLERDHSRAEFLEQRKLGAVHVARSKGPLALAGRRSVGRAARVKGIHTGEAATAAALRRINVTRGLGGARCVEGRAQPAPI